MKSLEQLRAAELAPFWMGPGGIPTALEELSEEEFAKLLAAHQAQYADAVNKTKA